MLCPQCCFCCRYSVLSALPCSRSVFHADTARSCRGGRSPRSTTCSVPVTRNCWSRCVWCTISPCVVATLRRRVASLSRLTWKEYVWQWEFAGARSLRFSVLFRPHRPRSPPARQNTCRRYSNLSWCTPFCLLAWSLTLSAISCNSSVTVTPRWIFANGRSVRFSMTLETALSPPWKPDGCSSKFWESACHCIICCSGYLTFLGCMHP